MSPNSSWNNLFDIPSEVTYLNGASNGPMLLSIEAVAEQALQKKQQPWTYTMDDWFDRTHRFRKLAARLIDCDEPERIAIIPSVSYGMANLAHNIQLEPGDEILIWSEQFPSNYYCWQRLAEKSGAVLKSIHSDLNTTLTDRLLSHINDRTRLIVISQVHWNTGEMVSLKQISHAIDGKDIKWILDLTQSLGVVPFSIQKYPVDAVVVTGYKWLLGPYGLGFAYFGPLFDHGEPIEEHWMNRVQSHRFDALADYQSDYRPLAWRYNMGEQVQHHTLPLFIHSIEIILSWDINLIHKHCAQLSDFLYDALKDKGYSLANFPKAPHILGIPMSSHEIAKQVVNDLRSKQIIVSKRDLYIRISMHVYNTNSDLERLIQNLPKK